jgi:hypothetical protein
LDNKLSHIRVTCTLQNLGWLSESDQTKLKITIKDLKYQDFTTSNRKNPLLLFHIKRILSHKNLDDPVDLLISLLYVCGHNGLLRGGELCSDLHVCDIIWDDDYLGFRLSLIRTKTFLTGDAVEVGFRDNNSPISAVKLMKKHFNLHNLWRKPNQHLFPSVIKSTNNKTGTLDWSKSFSKDNLRAIIRRDVASIGLNPLLYAGHSLRAGGATDLFNSRNISLVFIMFMGRWKTVEAAMAYFRDELNITETVSGIFGNLFFN